MSWASSGREILRRARRVSNGPPRAGRHSERIINRDGQDGQDKGSTSYPARPVRPCRFILTRGHRFDLQPGWSQVQTEVGSESFSSSQSSLQNLRSPSTMQVQVWCAHFFSSVLTGSAISNYLPSLPPVRVSAGPGCVSVRFDWSRTCIGGL